MANRIQFDVGFNIDKAGLNELKTALQQVQQQASQAVKTGNITNELKQAATAAQQLEGILNSAWNSKLNQLDLSKVSSGIKNTYGSVSQLKSALESSGSVGSTAYNKVASSILNTNLQLKEGNKLLNDMATTMSNTIKWGIASSIMNNMAGSIQQAYGFTKSLDRSLNDIRIVTNKSAEDMANFAVQANNAAKSLAAGTTDYTNASLIYYQQGLSDEEVQARTETTLKTANVTRQSASEVSELLTAVWNGYKVDADEAELYVDKLAAVAATTAADLEELSTGMSRVASAASMMGVDVDQLNAQLATIVSVTRQAPESVGTALRSIYARMGQLKTDGADDFGVTLGDYTKQMQQMGIEILDEQNNMREMGDVIEEVADKWGGWTQAQRVAAAQAMAGTRQYNNLVALFDNWDMYTAALETSANAMGTLQEQEDIYLESTEAHLQQLETELEKTFSLLLNSDAINTFADGFDFALSSLNNFLGGLGGGVNDFVYFGSLVANIFNNQIGAAIEKQITNFQALKANAEAIDLKQQVIDTHAARGESITNDTAAEVEAEYAQRLLNIRETLTATEYNEMTAIQSKIGLDEERLKIAESYKNQLEEIDIAENASLEYLQHRQRAEENGLQELRDRKINLEEVGYLTAEITDNNEENLSVLERVLQFNRDIENAAVEQGITTEEIDQFYDNILDGALKREEIESFLEKLLNGENAAYKNQEEYLQRLTEAIKNKQFYESEEYKVLKQQQELRKKELDQQIANREQQQAISGTIQGITALTMSLTTISGIVKTLGDDSLTAGEKAERVITTLLFSTPMLISNLKAITGLMPNLAVAIGAVSSTAEVGFFKATGAVLAFDTALGPLGVVLGVIAAAIGGIIGVSYALEKAYNADADAAKEAAETAKELKESYDDVKQSYDELKDSLSDYQNARDGLDQLIEGTDEWNEAVQSLNEQVLQLLEAYPELAKYISNDNGLLEISKEGQNALLEAQAQKTQAAYRTSLMGSMASNEAENKSNITDYRRDTLYWDPEKASTFMLSEESTNKVLDALDENGLSILENSDALAEVADITKVEADAILENREALITLSDKVQANTESNALYAQQIGQSILEGTKYENSQFGDQLSQLVGQRASDLYTDRYADIYKDKNKIGGLSDAMIQQQYNDMMGYGGVRNKNNNIGEYLVNGEWKEISDSVARAALAQKEAQEAATADIQTYVDAISALTGTTTVENEKVENALANFALKVGDLSNLTKDEVNALAESDFSKLSDDDDILKTLGFGSVKELEQLRTDAITAWNKNVRKVTEGMVQSVQDAFASIDTSDLSLAEMKDVADIFNLANAYGKLDEAISAYQAGTLEEFADGIRGVGTSLEDLQSQYAAIHKFMDGIKTGDTISADDFAVLSEESQKYFIAMLDGTYKLIGSAEEFQKVTQQDLIDKFRGQISDYADQNAGLSKISGYDFEKLSDVNYQRNSVDKTKINFDTDTVNQQIELVDKLGDQSEDTKIKIKEWQDQLESGSMSVEILQEIANAVRGCKEQFDNVDETIKSNSEQVDNLERAIAQTYDTVDELEEHIGEFENLDIFNERLLELENMLDEDIDPEALEDLADVIQDLADESDELSDSLKDNEEAAEDVAEAILRFDDACVDTVDNYEKWLAALNSGDLQEQATVVNDLRDAYADLLDIGGDSLSNEFLLNTDNLNLMHEAINGNINAYNALAEAVQQDIIAHLELSPEDQAAFYAEVANVQSLMDAMNFQDIEIGAYLNDSQFLQALTDMVNAAGMGVKDATDYLGSMGIQANVTEHDSEATELHQYMGAEAQVSTQSVDSVDPVTGEAVTYQIPSIHYRAVPVQTTATKENKAFSLEVESASKKSGGGFKFSQSKNGGGSSGAARRSSGGGGGGKKGGGGGSSKVKEPNKIDSLKKDTNRYHDIDLTIKGLETDFSRLGDQEKKLFGKDLINNLNEQLDILEKQKEAYEDKIALAQQEAKELRGTLAAQGVQFGADGYISNYASALQAKLDYTNSIIARYNSMSAEEQETFKDTVEDAKEDYEEFQKQIESYDKLISDTIPGLQDDIQDAIDKQIEIQIEKFTMEVEIRLDMAEAERDFNEFTRKVIDGIKDEDILGNATADLKDLLSYFNTNNTGIGPVQSLTDQVNATIKQIEQINSSGQGSAYGDNKAQALEDLKEYYEELMEQLEDVEDLIDEIKESYLDMIDEAIDKFDKQVDQYEYINDLIDHDMNVIGLLYGDDAYSEMARYYEKIEQNNNQELDFLKKRVQYAYDMMQAETDPEAREKWQEEWEDSLAELNDKVEDSIENIIDKYSNSINEVFSKLNDKITNGLGLDYVGEEWDLINKNADQYLDTINGMFAIQELENRYLDALDAEDSIAGQQKLNDLMNEQLGMLREKDKLTQYDVDRANMLFEITLKQIALQNAQQNKSNMRLRRDSQGNYTYQFVSDEESIAEAQKELAQAQNDLYNLDKDKYRQNLNDLYDIYSEFQDKLLELYQDQTLSAEEREQREALLVEQYNELINGLVEQNTEIRDNLYQSAFQSLANMYDNDVANFTNMAEEEQNILMNFLSNFANLTQEQQDLFMSNLSSFSGLTDQEIDILMNSLIPQWDSGVQHMADSFAGNGGLIPTCAEAFNSLKDVTSDYQNSLNELQRAANVNFNMIANGYDQNIDRAKRLLSANDDLINNYMKQVDAIKKVIAEMESLIKRYSDAKSAAESATKAAYQLWQQEQTNAAAAAKKSTTTSQSSATASAPKASTSASTSASAAKSSSGGDGVPRVGDVVTYIGGLYYYDEYGSKPTGKRGPGKKVTITYLHPGAPYPIHVQSNDSAYGWLRQDQISGYDTGGYTGEWGSNGRIGILHQKELVLNATDTENILSAVELIRGVHSLASGLNQSMLNRLASMSINMVNSNIPIDKQNNKVDQNVHIQAEFPNVHDAREIENALSNLVNIASQHAFNSKR